MRGIDWIGKAIDRIGTATTAWTLAGGATLMATVFGYTAGATEWINSYGPMGWLLAATFGVFAFLSMWLIFVKIRHVHWLHNYNRRQASSPDSADPMAESYRRQRIRLESIMPPFPGKLKNKTFENCDIIGPINVFPIGGFINSCSYFSADYIMITDEVAQRGSVYNVRIVEGCNFINCNFYNVSFIISERAFDVYDRAGGCNWITPIPTTTAAAPRILPPQGTARETRP